DDYFLMNSGEASELEFKITTLSQHSVEWWLNGKKLRVQSANSVFWSLQPGQWTLTVKQGTQQDTVDFQVQIAEKKPYHRGFSIVDTNK
ncbi:MAG: penicillin-binding protein 1C, partial [Planktothrix sp.]